MFSVFKFLRNLVVDVFLLKYVSIGNYENEISNMCILTSVDSDEPVQPPFKLRSSKCCSASSLKVIEYSSD